MSLLHGMTLLIRKGWLIFLVAFVMGGCKIQVVVQGEGTVQTPATGHFDCDHNGGLCIHEYNTGETEVFHAEAAPGYRFKKWVGCNYKTLTTCEVSFNDQAAADTSTVPITAVFEPINPPMEEAEYTYNALGQRMTKTVNNVTTIYQYDLDGKLISEHRSSGWTELQHVYLDGEPVAHIKRPVNNSGDKVYYVHTDHLGSPLLVTDTKQRVVVDIETTPFGDPYIAYSELDHYQRFPGQYSDSETGYHYNYFRDYDPSLGRYIQSDPIGLAGGLNTYAYVGGNPLSYVDPFGLAKISTQQTSDKGYGGGLGGPGAGVFCGGGRGRAPQLPNKLDTDAPTANKALGNAKKTNHIPQSKQPDRTFSPKNKKEAEEMGLDHRNQKLLEYTNSYGQKVHIRQDKRTRYQNPHFNAGKPGTKLKQHHYIGKPKSE